MAGGPLRVYPAPMARVGKIDVAVDVKLNMKNDPDVTAFEGCDVDARMVLRNVRIQQDRKNDEYIIENRDGTVLTVIPCARVRAQSFPLYEFLVRELEGIVCRGCGEILIENEGVQCGRCEAKQFSQMLEIRDRLVQGRKAHG